MQTASKKVKGERRSTTSEDDAWLAGDQPSKVDASPLQTPSGETKRTLTPDNVATTVANFIAAAPTLLGAAVRPRLSPALREKIFLAVTSVNDCRYCKWGHTHFAMAQGVPLEEINEILGHQTEALEAKDAGEAAAILFAQQYAENLDQIHPASAENLHRHYNDAEVTEIIAYVRFITLTNLTGNTLDVAFARFHSNFSSNLLEGAVVAAAAPLAIVLTQLAAFDPRVGMDPLRSYRQEFHRDASSKPGAEGKQ